MMRDPSATTLGLADSFGRLFGNLRNSGMQLSSTDAASKRTKKKNFFHKLKFEMNFLTTDINFRGTNLCLSDQDPNKVLNGKGCQLTYRDFEAVQHSDENFGYGEPEATTHYERLITSKVTLRGIVSTFPAAGNLELHNVRDVVERPHRREKLVSSPACVLFLDSTMDQDREWFLFGRDQRAIMSNPPCLVLGRMHRVRHELHLRNDELFIVFPKELVKEGISILWDSNRTNKTQAKLGRYVATELSQARSLRSDRQRSVPARSLRSDRSSQSFGRYVATDAIVPLGRYVVTELEPPLWSYVADPSDRPAPKLGRYVCYRARAKARSLRSDRSIVPLGRYVATELSQARSLRSAERSSRSVVRSDRARSQSSVVPKRDDAIVPLGRYVATSSSQSSGDVALGVELPSAIVPLGRTLATELKPKLGRYVATERSSRSVVRSDRARAKLWSRCSD
ncbi:hypothetical protein IGI04_007242 [Brassica rapa subsp. trilocularis]|uniref:Uncharacterized protein n=1 Tax=Brassica rapa subsp. trilocularis TaxID=1813537 RepID=A0ABQ7NJH8_BRACM|nr:hypothetical protein IGI04_007242 [Brassica rapa subsp. trilocularis]